MQIINLITLAIINTRVDADIPKIEASDLLNRGLNIAYFIIGAIAVIMIIIAGFTMVTSVGNADAVKKAKNTITYSVVGLVFVIMAFTITHFVMKGFQ